MCVFCAAIPVAASLGAKAKSQQMRKEREALEAGQPAPPRRIPAGRITAAAIGGLVVASVVYHTHLLTPL